MDKCTLTFEGNQGGTYYVPCDKVQYFTNDLINTSNQLVLLESGHAHNNFNLRCASNKYCSYYSGNYTHYVTNARVTGYNLQSRINREFNSVVIPLVSIFCIFVIMFRSLKQW